MFCVRGEAVMIRMAQCSQTSRLPCLHPRIHPPLIKGNKLTPAGNVATESLSGKQEITEGTK